MLLNTQDKAIQAYNLAQQALDEIENLPSGGGGVQSVNNQLPDQDGNVTIEVGTALVKKSITLTAAGWVSDAQTVSIAGLLADDDVLVAADPASYDDWNTAGVRAVSQAAGSITFECTATPSTDLAGNVIVGRLGT